MESAAAAFTSMPETVDERMDLITRNLQETLGRDKLRSIMAEREVSIYWGTAPTGRPHIGYFVPMVKLADFLRAGAHVTVLFADIHAYLDNMKSSWDQLKLRTQYYQQVIKAILTTIGVPIDKLRFVVGSEYQLERKYTLDVYRLEAIVSEHDAKKAGAEVVKQVASPALSGLVYPLLQALDEEYLECDAQFGGVDQRKIFTFAEKYLPQLGYRKRSHLMNAMVGGLNGSKMSSSDANSKIDLLDSADMVKQKIKMAFCEEGNIENNPILAFSRAVIFPAFDLWNMNHADAPRRCFEIIRPEKFGGHLSIATFEELQTLFAAKEIHPGDLKNGFAAALVSLLDPIRAFCDTPETQALLAKAYPAPVPAIQADVSRIDLRVGVVTHVAVHPENPAQYVETVDLGPELGERTIVSGIAAHITPEQLTGKSVIVAANVKPSKFRGVASHGMLLAATVAEPAPKVELLVPDEDAKAGDLVTIAGFERKPDAQLNPKHKILEKVMPDFSIDAEGVLVFKSPRADAPVQPKVANNAITVPTLRNAAVA